MSCGEITVGSRRGVEGSWWADSQQAVRPQGCCRSCAASGLLCAEEWWKAVSGHGMVTVVTGVILHTLGGRSHQLFSNVRQE